MADAEAGTLRLSETVVDPRLEVMAALDGMAAAIEQGGLTAEAVIPENLPLLFADDRAVRQIVGALLSNAVKFTPRGGRITVTLGLSDAGLLTLTVTDTGIGIPADKLDHVLEPFGLLDAGFTREHAGTGLGLPLSRSMAELHGGHLEIETVLGQGTTVTVRLPANRLLQPGQELEQLILGRPD
jgi:signal transduction histidine kinase